MTQFIIMLVYENYSPSTFKASFLFSSYFDDGGGDVDIVKGWKQNFKFNL